MWVQPKNFNFFKNIGSRAGRVQDIQINEQFQIFYDSCKDKIINPNQSCLIRSHLVKEANGSFNSLIVSNVNQESNSQSIQWIVRTPGDKISCTSQIAGVKAANITWTGSEYSGCIIEECLDSHHLKQNICELNAISCEEGNGKGTKTWVNGGYGDCALSECNPGFDFISNQCYSQCLASEHREPLQCTANIQPCIENHKVGQKTWNGTGYNSCVFSGCELGYEPVADQCLVPCQSTEHREGLSCVPNVQVCQENNGSGTKTWLGSDYSSCQINSCSEGFDLVSGQCYAECSSGSHREGTVCLADTQACTEGAGYGTKQWNGNSYNACVLEGCNGADFIGGQCYSYCTASEHRVGTSCVSNTQSCPIANGTGSQQWNGSGWGTCTIVSCNTAGGYYDRGDGVTCRQSSGTYRVGLGGFSINGGGQITTGGIRLAQQTDGNLVIYRVNTPLWNSQIGTGCGGGCVARFQGDGNFVSQRNSPFTPYYQSATQAVNGAHSFQFKDDCPYYKVIHNSAGKAIWSTFSKYLEGGGGGYNQVCF